jgi:hypothetical protein
VTPTACLLQNPRKSLCPSWSYNSPRQRPRLNSLKLRSQSHRSPARCRGLDEARLNSTVLFGPCQSFKGINRTSVTNIEKMNLALRGLRVPQGLSQLGATLSAISSVNLRGVASSHRHVRKEPRPHQDSEEPADDLESAPADWECRQHGSDGDGALQTASTGIRAPRSLNTINRQMAKMPGSFSAASNAAMGFNNTIRTAP